MSRSGYSDDCYDDFAFVRWRGIVSNSIRGKRGQQFLRDLISALDEMPVKQLICNDLQKKDTGEVCAIGALGVKRGINMHNIDPEDYDVVATKFNIASPLAQEVVYMNDEHYHYLTPAERWLKMRDWAMSLLK